MMSAGIIIRPFLIPCAMRRASWVLGLCQTVLVCADRALPFLQHPETPGMPRDPRTSYRRNLDHTAVYIWALDVRFWIITQCPLLFCGRLRVIVVSGEKFLSALIVFTLSFLLRPDINVLPRNFYNRIFMMLLQGF